MLRFWILIGILLITQASWSAELSFNYSGFRRVAIFPWSLGPGLDGEEAWWKMRESLTKDRRFLVASQKLMQNRSVYQPRKMLSTADAVILGRVLEAEVLLSVYLEGQILNLQVIRASDGMNLAFLKKDLHPAVPLQDQLVRAGEDLVRDLLRLLPDEGFLVKEEGETSFFRTQGFKVTARAFLGQSSSISFGDELQIFRLKSKGLPLLQAEQELEVIARGEVVAIEGHQVSLAMKDLADLNLSDESVLVRSVRKADPTLNQIEGLALSGLVETQSSELVSVNELQGKGSGPTTALTFLANLAIFILVAF